MKELLPYETYLKTFGLILEQERDGLIVVDIKKKSYPIVYTNKGIYHTTGYKKDKLLGKSLDILYENVFPLDLKEKVESLFNKRKMLIIYNRYKKKDRTSIDLSISVTVIKNSHNKPNFLFLVLRDITDVVFLTKEKTAIKVSTALIESIYDVINNYFNYILVFRDDISELNEEFNNKNIKELLKEFDLQFKEAKNALSKFGDISIIMQNILPKNLEIIDLR